MRIKKIDIPETTDSNDGLHHIKMDKLDNIVLIAGKNGSGKTRILNKVFNTFCNKPQQSKLKEVILQKKQYNKEIEVLESNIEIFENQLKEETNSNRREERIIQIDNHNAQIEQYKGLLKNCEEVENWNLIETDIESDNYSFVHFVPKRLDIQDCNTFAKNQIISFASSIDNVGIDNLPNGVFAKIQVIQDRWFNATHQHTQVTGEDKTRAIEDYEKLQNIIEIFLNTKITRTIKVASH